VKAIGSTILTEHSVANCAFGSGVTLGRNGFCASRAGRRGVESSNGIVSMSLFSAMQVVIQEEEERW
jgi:hypothetical protein